jgi:class 3 adenylate cyclase/pSer/pThr/pTyr-binding forkhead associated (FHA) protein
MSASPSQQIEDLEKQRRDLALIVADIIAGAGVEQHHPDTAEVLTFGQCHDTMLKPVVAAHNGTTVKASGTVFMAWFPEIKDALLAAVEMQRSLLRFNATRPPRQQMFLRMAIHHGQGIPRETDVYGDVANLGWRIESIAGPNQIVASDAIFDAVGRSSVVQLSHLGRFRLTEQEAERDLYEVLWTKDAIPSTVKAHAMVSGAPRKTMSRYAVQHIKPDGSVGQQVEVKGKITLGRSYGELKFAGDENLAPMHARFTVDHGQVFVEDLMKQGSGVYVRLVSTYTLQDGDTVWMGKHLFRFREKPRAAATPGKEKVDPNLPPTAALLGTGPTAELVVIKDGKLDENEKYALGEAEASFGRVRGTFTFADDPIMSGFHARIYQRGDNFFLEDEGSTNGTYLKVRGRAPVPAGASVRAGAQMMRIIELGS